MAKRGWSLTDAQLTNLRETNLRESWGEHKRRQKLNPAARSAQAPRKPKPVSRPSPDRIRERSQIGGGFGGVKGRNVPRGAYDPMTYGKPDVASLGDPVSSYDVGTTYTTKRKAQELQPSPEWRGGPWTDQSNVPLRQQAGGGPSPSGEFGQFRRTQSTQEAYRAADTSMYNSNVTPKAKRVENKIPRSRMSPDQNVFW